VSPEPIAANGDSSPAALAIPATRISSIDTIRGAALLGILAINIVGFAQPRQSIEFPTVAGGFQGANFFLWCIADVLFEGKMRAIFSMLFGASAILFTVGKELGSPSARVADLYYRRTLWLICFGIVHAYGLWPGDILFSYGLIGLVLYPIRSVAPRRLIAAGLISLVILSAKDLLHGLELRDLRNRALGAVAATGGDASPEVLKARQEWDEEVRNVKPTREDVAQMVRSRRGGYWSQFSTRAALARESESVQLYDRDCWDVLGMMLIGMGLFKIGFFSARRSQREYTAAAVIGYGAGLPIAVYFITWNIASDFDPALRALLSGGHQFVR
jgi:uncharacterized protein